MPENRLKILQIIIAFKPSTFGGIKNHLDYQTKEMIRQGHEVTICTSNAYDRTKNNDRYGLYNIDGINIRYFNRIHPRKMFIVPGIIFHIKNNIKYYDIVHLQDFRTFINVVAYYYARKNNIPYVISAGGSVPYSGNIFKIIKKTIFDLIVGNKMLLNASNLIALTEVEVNQYHKAGVKKKYITIVPNGIDPNETKKYENIDCFRNKYSINDKYIVTFVGRVHEIKGLNYLVESFKLTLLQIPSAVLIIAGGDHGYLKKLTDIVLKLGISENVLFIGFISGCDKWALYQASDLLVLPSKKESFGNVIPEAALLRTPVILTDGCALSDIVQNNGFGVKVPFGDISTLSCEIVKILQDKKMRKKMSEKGRNYTLENWTWQKSTKILLSIYESAI